MSSSSSFPNSSFASSSHALSVVSLNAGAHLTNVHELEAFVHLLEEHVGGWGICFLSEVDGRARFEDYCIHLSISRVRVYFHHPGVGGRTMAWLIKYSLLCSIASVDWIDRCGSLRFRSPSRSRQCPVIVGVHGPHSSDLLELFSSISQLICGCSCFEIGIVWAVNICITA